jgi:hypothetical protein
MNLVGLTLGSQTNNKEKYRGAAGGRNQSASCHTSNIRKGEYHGAEDTAMSHKESTISASSSCLSLTM